MIFTIRAGNRKDYYCLIGIAYDAGFLAKKGTGGFVVQIEIPVQTIQDWEQDQEDGWDKYEIFLDKIDECCPETIIDVPSRDILLLSTQITLDGELK